jgi:hypothetical protein
MKIKMAALALLCHKAPRSLRESRQGLLTKASAIPTRRYTDRICEFPGKFAYFVTQ